MRRPLTAVARETVVAQLRPGDLAVDATVGNGHDTLSLARAVAPGGRVFGFDTQEAALAATRARLVASGLGNVVALHHRGHERLRETLPTDTYGQVGAAMFNLGYLPGGDKRLITRAETTLPALDQALVMLRNGGVLSVVLYRGHAGADDETSAVTAWIHRHATELRVETHESPGPVLYVVRRPD